MRKFFKIHTVLALVPFKITTTPEFAGTVGVEDGEGVVKEKIEDEYMKKDKLGFVGKEDIGSESEDEEGTGCKMTRKQTMIKSLSWRL